MKTNHYTVKSLRKNTCSHAGAGHLSFLRNALVCCLLLLLPALITYKANAQLNGTYTIDASKSASSTNYHSFTSAVNDLMYGTRTDTGTSNGPGISGNVTFRVADGTYDEFLHIGYISKSQWYHKVTFISSSGDRTKVILQNSTRISATPYTVQLDSADGISFEKMTISGAFTPSTNDAVIKCTNGIANFSIKNCLLKGYSASNPHTLIIDILDSSVIQKDSLIDIRNNSFQNGTTGIKWSSYNTSSTLFYLMNNTFSSTVTNGVLILGNSTLDYIDGNTFHGSGTAIRVLDVKPISVSANRIYSSSVGILISYTHLDSTYSTDIINNEIVATEKGIWLKGNMTRVLHNSIYIKPKQTFNGTEIGLSAELRNGSTIVYNNSIYGLSKAVTFDLTQQYIWLTLRNNNYYSHNDTIGEYKPYGSNKSIYQSMSSWSSGVSTEANSISVDPKYTSSTYLYPGNQVLYGAGTNTSWLVSKDIENTSRLNPPTIGAYEAFSVDLGPDTVLCPGQCIHLRAPQSGKWSTGQTSDTITYCPAAPGNVYVTVTNSIGTFSDTIFIDLDTNKINLSIPSSTLICSGDSLYIDATGMQSYSWSPPTGVSNPIGGQVWLKPATTTYYKFTAKGTADCSRFDTLIVVTVDTSQALTLSQHNLTICHGGATKLQAPAATAYKWYPSTGLSSTTVQEPVASPQQTTWYYVDMTSVCGNIYTDSVLVEVDSPMNANLNEHFANLCQGDSAQFIITGADNAYWKSDYTGQSFYGLDVWLKPQRNDRFAVTYIKGSCTEMDSVIIEVDTIPHYLQAHSYNICKGGSVKLRAFGGSSYSWWPATGLSNTASATPVASPSVTTTYYVQTTGQYCMTIDSVTVHVDTSKPVIPQKSYSICRGQSVQLSVAGMDSVYWMGDSSLSAYNIPNPVATPMYTTAYLAYSYSASCTFADTIIVYVDTMNATLNNQLQVICKGDSVQLTASGATAYNWSPSATLSSTSGASVWASPTASTWYSVSMSKGACTTTDSVLVLVDSTCVWPGDANYNKIANVFDILHIGLAYGETGPKRPNANNSWVQQACQDWKNSFSSGVNYKHADCNGDGVVDAGDLTPLALNYGKTHPKKGSGGSGDPDDPHITLKFEKDSFNAGDTAYASIILGSEDNKVQGIYGIAFTLNYDPDYYDTSTLKVDLAKSWLGTTGTDLISISYTYKSSGKVDIGVSRTDHKAVTGYGTVGRLSIVIQDNVAGKRTIHRQLNTWVDEIKAIGTKGEEIPIYAEEDEYVISQDISSVPEEPLTENDLNIYPNPASEWLTIEATNSRILEIRITNLLGQDVLHRQLNATAIQQLPLSGMQPGIYTITIRTDAGVSVRRFIKQ